MNMSLVALTDRALQAARELRHEHRTPRKPQEPPSFAWMAPELTGRTAHDADQRSDLYALGALFYGWATGRQPFEASDPLRMIHDQLTRTPVPPMALRPDFPKVFSDIIMRLLEKEPERRYQSVEGLAYDLQRLRRLLVRGQEAEFTLGERDFPRQLPAPVHPVGRQRELDRLRAGVEAAANGDCRVVMLGGPAGAGKSALVHELRALAATHAGRFVSGKFGPYGEQGPGAAVQALGALGRLLLAEPEKELAHQRQRILEVLGPQAGVICTAIPEFKLLLGDLPQPPATDPSNEVARLRTLTLNLLRAVATRDHPLVMVLEDLQWSPDATAQFIESILDGEGPQGFLLVGTWRQDELPPGHPLASAFAKWRAEGRPLEELRLGNLAEPDVAQMLREMLRMPIAEAGDLAAALMRHTGGNPKSIVDLVNALRRDGVLSPNSRGWRWNIDELERYAEGTAATDLLAVRISRLPRTARELLEALACLRADAGVELAAAATGLGARELQARCARLAEEGLLLREPGPPSLLRLQESVSRAAYASLDERRRTQLHLALARRLAAHGGLEMEVAGQYLAAAPAIEDSEECVSAAAVLHSAAGRLIVSANDTAAQQLLRAALELLGRAASLGQSAASRQLACELDLHLALCRLGRLDEADDVYARIELLEPDPLAMADAACAQVGSLYNRGRVAQAVTHGLQFLLHLGFDTVADLDGAEAGDVVEQLRRWLHDFDAAREQERAEAADPRVIAAANMFVRLGPTCFYARTPLACWLVRESMALWDRQGPCASLTVSLGLASLVTDTTGDWRTGYLVGRRMIAFCEAKGWEPACSQSRQLFAIGSSHWFEPIEQGLEQAARAREGLLKCGDLQGACFSYRVSMVEVFECAASLNRYAQEVHAGLELARRVGARQVVATFAAARQLLRALRGETTGAGAFDDAEFSESRHLADNASTPMAMVGYHIMRALAAAIFGDAPALSAHARAGVSLMTRQSFYTTAWAHWMLALGLAWELQESPPGSKTPHADKLVELERSLGWLGHRAVDAPANFRHIYLHLLAERAWAAGEIATAAACFDNALNAAEGAARPWHRALITERAGRFHRAWARARYGNELLAQAHQLYMSWGATAKAAQLAAEIGMPRMGAGSPHGPAADSLDTLALLRASQALSSERNPARLRARVEEVLGSVAGATKVVLALRDEEAGDWVLQAEEGQTETVSVAAASHRVPLSALRYAERTGEPLLLADAVADGRFARDPYFRDVERCSLMVVPILHQGAARAILVLENRASRGAFSATRLDAVTMIAGQLAVSLENAQLYERLQRKVSEQTQQLREAQSRLLSEARRAGMNQIATNVLHNVGNVLTSVNVSAHVLATQVRQSPASRVRDLARLLNEQAHDLAAFFGPGGKGRMLPAYLHELADALAREKEQLLGELERLCSSVDHIKNVVAMQQSYAGGGRVLEPARIADLVDDALRIQEASLSRHGVQVQRDYSPVEVAPLDKTRVMQILVNLLENARQAMNEVEGERCMKVSVRQESGSIVVSVRDWGCGISTENLRRIFSHGFTTKAEGHGFGLHSCAIAAQEMRGSLTAHSDGPGKGATFVLRLPAS
jgi:signal transduction histidine kinase